MISSFQLKTTAATLDYHADALRGNSRENALDEYEQTTATWGGKGAEYAGFGVGRAVSEKDLTDALNGNLENQQIKGGNHKDYGSNYHKPGMDFTFSPDKSVSVACLVGGDDRIKAAHGAAVEKAMQFLEKQGATARVGGTKKATGNLLYAKFEHNTSRAQDPQVHTHVVIANATKDQETGKWHALDNKPLLELRKEADGIYNQALGESLQKLGYHTETTKNGVAIAGYEPEQLKAFSARSGAIDEYLHAKGVAPERASSAQKQVANLATREEKTHATLSELKTSWEKKAAAVGLNVEKLSRETAPPARIANAQVEQPAVDAALAKLVDGATEAGQKFDRLAASLQYAGNDAPVKSLLGELSALHKAQAPQTLQDYGKAIRQQEGLRFATNEQVAAAAAKLVDAGKLTAAVGADRQGAVVYGGDTGQSESRTQALEGVKSRGVEQAIQAIADKMTAAAKAFDTQMVGSLEAKDPKLAQEIANSLQQFKKEQTPRSGKQLAFELRKDADFKYLSNAQIDKALNSLVEKGKLQLDTGEKGDTRYGPDVKASAEREAAYAKVSAQVVDKFVGEQLTRQAGAGQLFDAQAQFALKSDNKEQVSAVYDTLRQLNREQSPKTAAQMAFAVRESSGNDFIPKAQVQDSLDRLVAAGKLQVKEGADPKDTRYSADFNEAAARSERLLEVAEKTRQPTQAAIGKALGVVIERMEANHAILKEAQSELKALSPTDTSTRRTRLLSTIKEAEKSTQYTVAGMRKAIQAELKEFAYAPALDAAVLKAVDNGALHKNLNKISIESEAQTDARLKELGSINKEFRTEVNSLRNELRAAQRAEVQANKATERRIAMEERIVASGRDPTNSRPSATLEIVGGAVSVIKAVVQPRTTIKRLGRRAIYKGVPAAVKQVGHAATAATKGVAWGVVKGFGAQVRAWDAATGTTTRVGGVISAALTRNSAGVSAALAAPTGSREKVIAIKDAARANLRKVEQKAGYFKDGQGSSHRMKLSLGNAILVAGITVASTPGLSNTTFALTAKTEMLRQIKTTKVSAVEALAAKAVIAVGKAIGQALVYVGKTNRPEAHVARVEKAQAAMATAYKNYFAATAATPGAALSSSKQEAAQATLLKAEVVLSKAYTKFENESYKQRHTGVIGAKQYEIAQERVAKYREAADEFKGAFARVEASKGLVGALDKLDALGKPGANRTEAAGEFSQIKAEVLKNLGTITAQQSEVVNSRLRQAHTSPTAMKEFESAKQALATLKAFSQRTADLEPKDLARDSKIMAMAKELKQKLTKDINGAADMKHVSVSAQQVLTGLNSRELLKAQAAGGKDHIGEQMAAAKEAQKAKRTERARSNNKQNADRAEQARTAKGFAY